MNLSIVVVGVDLLVFEGECVVGVVFDDGMILYVKVVVLVIGIFFNVWMFCGYDIDEGGCVGEWVVMGFGV